MKEPQIVEDYVGWIYAEGFGYKDGFFESVDDLIDYLEDEEIPLENWPEKVYCCAPVEFPSFSAIDIVEDALIESYEDAIDDVSGLEELQKAFDAFTELNKNVVSQEVDYKRAVLIQKPDKNENTNVTDTSSNT